MERIEDIIKDLREVNNQVIDAMLAEITHLKEENVVLRNAARDIDETELVLDKYSDIITDKEKAKRTIDEIRNRVE